MSTRYVRSAASAAAPMSGDSGPMTKGGSTQSYAKDSFRFRAIQARIATCGPPKEDQMNKTFTVVREMKWDDNLQKDCKAHKPVVETPGRPYVAYCSECGACAYIKNTIVRVAQ